MCVFRWLYCLAIVPSGLHSPLARGLLLSWRRFVCCRCRLLLGLGCAVVCADCLRAAASFSRYLALVRVGLSLVLPSLRSSFLSVLFLLLFLPRSGLLMLRLQRELLFCALVFAYIRLSSSRWVLWFFLCFCSTSAPPSPGRLCWCFWLAFPAGCSLPVVPAARCVTLTCLGALWRSCACAPPTPVMCFRSAPRSSLLW